MSFDEWKRHYSSYDPPSMIAEAMTFEHAVPLDRMNAFLVRLVEIASNFPEMPYDERLKAAALAITAVQMVRSKGEKEGILERIDAALSKTFEINKTYSLYPAITGVIEEGGYDRRNPIGEILATGKPS